MTLAGLRGPDPRFLDDCAGSGQGDPTTDVTRILDAMQGGDLDRTALAALFHHDPPPPDTSENHPTSPVIPASGKPTPAASSDGQHRWPSDADLSDGA